MKGKILIATLLFVSLAFLSCDYNDPAAPNWGYAYCQHEGKPIYIIKDSTRIISGVIKNIGGSTAYDVRVLWEWYKTEDKSTKFKQKIININPSNLEAGKLGTYHFEVKGMPKCCIYQYTIQWSNLP